ncbi:MAG: thermonuclease family protein [Candidatus Thiodiazotropha sp. (ex Lucina pensylvanica)]|nr:thermonuclease family protein [Candidatus Thiodiazotropha sp. (ex Lucina pensylvanica)]MBT3050728.1 thermonuclease family protein [Candidatus Thiodiazotropha sp. (ex Codakia orbicularis)]
MPNRSIPPYRNLQQRLLVFLLIGLSLGSSCHAAMLEGQVVGILSGDRITLRPADGIYREIKLSGIRIPTHDKNMKKIAQRHLNMLLAGRFVSVEYNTLSARGVILGTVLHGGSDMALRMLSDGLAVTTNHPRLQPSRLRRYEQAEATARARGLGFWQKLR